ncbi:MAG TPA: dienelactone hydrolase family protein [Stellaceae bacterium]|nr:dienelactone hydrolase family protein [Stellaceae bacterium]
MALIERELETQGLLPRGSWSRRGFVMTSLASGFALSMQPVSAETITTDAQGLLAGEVKVPTADGEMPTYRAMPEAGGPFPTVLVVHEAFGVHEHVKDLCRRFAKLGYYAIAPELFARQGNAAALKEPAQIGKLLAGVPTAELMSDLDAAVIYAKASGKADTARLGITGFCWGGFVTWMYAAHNPALKAAVSWYGPDRKLTALTPQNPAEIAAELKCPVLALYGGQDKSITPEIIDKRRAACQAAGKTCENKIYPDSPHGFNADYRSSYNAADARDGWARMLAWFKDHGAA